MPQRVCKSDRIQKQIVVCWIVGFGLFKEIVNNKKNI